MRTVWFILTLALLVVSCDNMLLGDDEPIVPLEENLQPPPVLNDGWDASDLASQNIDAARVQRMIEFIQNNPNNIHSVIIVRNNKLVSESYFTGWHRERLHALRSVSKTFVSTVTGIAIEKGYYSVDSAVAGFLPEYAGSMGDGKQQIQIKHLLTMTSGIDWDEKTYPSDDPRNDETSFDRSDQRLQYLFEKKMAFRPGEHFEYNSALPVVEAAIIHKATGLDVPVFAEENFFKSLGITNYFWRTDENDGYLTAIGPLFLCPRDMAKLGQVFLDSGVWKGQRIVSKQWVKDATTTFIGNADDGEGYGYHWWTARYDVAGEKIEVFYARGSGGQYIFVIPSRNAVVVFTSGNYPPRRQDAPVGMLMNIIVPSMRK